VGHLRHHPIVIVGLAAKPLIEGSQASLWVVAGSLIVGSGYMWSADQMGRHKRGEDDVPHGGCRTARPPLHGPPPGDIGRTSYLP
jgi:undecaprenyl pyrophosphate phosphatase UppP